MQLSGRLISFKTSGLITGRTAVNALAEFTHCLLSYIAIHSLSSLHSYMHLVCTCTLTCLSNKKKNIKLALTSKHASVI